MMRGKTPMRFNRIRGNAHDFRPGCRVIFPSIADRAHLPRTDRSLVAGIKEEHDYLAAMIRQAPRYAVAVRQREVGRFASFLGM